MEIERMLYRRYKTSYADCETVLGSYDKATKTIEVMLPEGRLSGNWCRLLASTQRSKKRPKNIPIMLILSESSGFNPAIIITGRRDAPAWHT